ncbi:MAG TPA: alkaline phosphatase family protein [Vicinamibacterales bacterium]|nr:alkaline phosphatase family protein [Vicinamibacterales bacterium]
MICVRRLSALALLAAVAIGWPASPRAGGVQDGARPKLVVIIVVDQMRADYLDWYAANFTSGFARLKREGAVFTNAAYPYLNTITCAGHSTIGTGTFPYRHGMILNNWYDRKTGKSPYCTDDPTMKEISYNGLSSVQGDSARRLLAPAIGEQIMNRGGRSVAISLKPRSAVTLTGHKSTAVVWFDDRGGWTTSTAFTKTPVPYLQEFIKANPLTADFDKVWERTLPASAYQGEDEVKSEGTTAGWTRSFPHVMGVRGAKESEFYAHWQRSPFADEYVARLAMASIDELKLGRGKAADFLGVSFSAVDGVGHLFGPRSHEIQDTLIRLDRTIGGLLDHLDKTVGQGNYVLGLSADHGVAEVPEQTGGGRISSKSVAQALEAVLVPALGPGRHVAATVYTNVYLSEDARKRLGRDRTLRAAALDAVRGVKGIKYVFWGRDLASAAARQSSDPVMRAAALSHHPDRSGDIIVAPAENWILSTSVTTHGTQYAYDQRVPVILLGASVRAGTYTSGATPADLAPTLAAAANVKIGPTDGRVLKEALSPGRSTAVE